MFRAFGLPLLACYKSCGTEWDFQDVGLHAIGAHRRGQKRDCRGLLAAAAAPVAAVRLRQFGADQRPFHAIVRLRCDGECTARRHAARAVRRRAPRQRPRGRRAARRRSRTVPAVAIRDGASTLQVGTKGNSIADNSDLRYQGTIVRNARDCTLFGGQVNARVGIQGRVIVGPAGAPSTVDLPIRIAVVQEGVEPKTIATKLYRQQIDLGGMDNVPFSFVAEDFSFPMPPPNVVDAYVIYIGFDPEGARRARRRGSRGKRSASRRG